MLAGVGVARTWGERLDGLPLAHVDIARDPDLAVLLADADGRIGSGLGAAIVGGHILHLSSKPGGTASPRTVRDAGELVDAFAVLGDEHLPITVAIDLDLDLAEPTEFAVPPASNDDVVLTLSPAFADANVVVVAGPGVARGGYDLGLRNLADRTGWQVLNTWGAKGVLAWFDDHHGGTVGLQRQDLALAGIDDADLVVATGLDRDEVGSDVFGSVLVQEVPPWQLAALTHRWEPVARPPAPRAAFFGSVSAAVTPMYEATTVPLAPARAALHLSGARPDDGLVVADAGVAGFWLARTYPTREVGSVVVPATVQPGFAAAAAVAASAAGRPCVAVVDGPLDESTRIVLDAARSLGIPVALQVWGDAGGRDDVDAHARASEAQFGGRHEVLEVPIRQGDLDTLVEIAGPVVAWPGMSIEPDS